MMKYHEGQTLSTIIADNPLILMAMSRFGITMGFGDKTVATICREQNVDCATFLAVINYISTGHVSLDNLSLPSLIYYLDNAHTYFLDFCLPMIRRKLIDAIGLSTKNELSMVILKFYDEYVEEVRRHMDYETREVFGYVRRLIDGRSDPAYNIDIFASHHHSIHDRLLELKDILIRYLPGGNSNLLNVVLFDIINCEQDLVSHCGVEDNLFVPVVRRLEGQTRQNGAQAARKGADSSAPSEEPISARERDIIECVALGLSNKEIADRLCISVNTVTTHRRNIAQKLQIHSAAGLAIYAVLNGIISIDQLQ